MRGWRYKQIIIILCLLPLLNGCRVIVFDEKKEERKAEKFVHNPNNEVQVNATVQLFKKKLLVRGETTLPKGTVIDVQLKPYPESATSLQIVRNTVDPLDSVAASGIIKVKKDGTLESITVTRPGEDKRYRLEIVLDPRKQNKDVQTVLGPLGENIGNSDGHVSVTQETEEITLIKKFANIMKREEPDGFMSKIDLTALKE